jgi:hypothetical protein
MKKLLILATLCLTACAIHDKPSAPVAKAKTDKPGIRLTLLPQNPPAPGKTVTVLAKLSRKDGTLVTDDDLDTIHTQKFHLLVIDPSLSDYQHIHPQKLASGAYSFSFTPKLANGYRAWADITPTATHQQELVFADLGKPRAMIIDKASVHEATVDGYHFALSFDKPPTVGSASMGTIVIYDKLGLPVTVLEPVMGAFAHIVGFHENFRTIMHTHPMDDEPQNADARGGPEIMFHFEPDRSGFIRLFAQVRINGRDLYVPFGVQVAPAS